MTGSFSGFWYSENLIDWYFNEGEGLMRGAAGDFVLLATTSTILLLVLKSVSLPVRKIL